jgi:hypothetical protein
LTRSSQKTLVVIRPAAIAIIAATCMLISLSTASLAADHPRFGGDAYALAIDAPPVIPATTVADTGELHPKGGTLSASLASFTVGGVIDLDTLQANIDGSGMKTTSTASVADLNLLPSGIALTASAITATSNAVCTGEYGNTTIDGLSIGGKPVDVTGEPNQRIDLPGLGFVVINQQIVQSGPGYHHLIVNALRVELLSGVDVTVCHANSILECVPAGTTDYSGRATGILTRVPGVEADRFGDTGELPHGGGHIHVVQEGVNVDDLLTAGTIDSTTEGSAGVATSNSTVQNLVISPSDSVSLKVDAVEADSKSTSSGVSGSSSITNLVLNGSSITVTGEPNQIVTIPGVLTLIINERTTVHFGDYYEISVNALDLKVVGGAQVVVAHAESDLDSP